MPIFIFFASSVLRVSREEFKTTARNETTPVLGQGFIQFILDPVARQQVFFHVLIIIKKKKGNKKEKKCTCVSSSYCMMHEKQEKIGSSEMDYFRGGVKCTEVIRHLVFLTSVVLTKNRLVLLHVQNGTCERITWVLSEVQCL